MSESQPHMTTSTTSVCRSDGDHIRRRPGRLRYAALGCLALIGASLAGCGSSDGSSTSTTDKEEICQARDDLQTSVTALTNPALLTQGTTAITAAVDDVKADVANLKPAASADYQPQFESLQTSIDDLETATGNLGNGNIAGNLTAVGTAIASVGTSATTLLTQLKATCD